MFAKINLQHINNCESEKVRKFLTFSLGTYIELNRRKHVRLSSHFLFTGQTIRFSNNPHLGRCDTKGRKADKSSKACLIATRIY